MKIGYQSIDKRGFASQLALLAYTASAALTFLPAALAVPATSARSLNQVPPSHQKLPATAQGDGAQPQPQTKEEKQLTSVEQKMLQQTYPTDFVDKRLQRLELMLFGATQYGTREERLARIEGQTKGRFAAPPSKEAAAQMTKQIGSMETKLLKRTYAGESTEKRLARLETKTLGVTNANLPAPERAQRLARIINAPDDADISQMSPGAGQMPRIGRLPGGINGMVVPFGNRGMSGMPPGFGAMPPGFEGGMPPGFSGMTPFGDLRQFFGQSGGMDGQTQQQFRFEMSDGNGHTYSYQSPDLQSPDSHRPDNGSGRRRSTPFQVPKQPMPQISPHQFSQPQELPEMPDSRLPPYVDQNSI